MPRGPAQPWRARKPPVTDDYIMAAVNEAGGLGNHSPEGHYATLVIRGFADCDEAIEYKKSLYRCAHWMSRNGIADVSISQCDIERDKGMTWKITFRVSDKTMARQYHLDNHGDDPSRWAYDPTRKGQRQ